MRFSRLLTTSRRRMTCAVSIPETSRFQDQRTLCCSCRGHFSRWTRALRSCSAAVKSRPQPAIPLRFPPSFRCRCRACRRFGRRVPATWWRSVNFCLSQSEAARTGTPSSRSPPWTLSTSRHRESRRGDGGRSGRGSERDAETSRTGSCPTAVRHDGEHEAHSRHRRRPHRRIRRGNDQVARRRWERMSSASSPSGAPRSRKAAGSNGSRTAAPLGASPRGALGGGTGGPDAEALIRGLVDEDCRARGSGRQCGLEKSSHTSSFVAHGRAVRVHRIRLAQARVRDPRRGLRQAVERGGLLSRAETRVDVCLAEARHIERRGPFVDFPGKVHQAKVTVDAGD